MGQNKEQLKKLLNFIDSLSKQKGNEWFVSELQKRYGERKSTEVWEDVADDIKYIGDILGIRANVSIDYSFISHETLKKQLTIDNLRMENAVLDLKENNEVERFYNFCVNTFYQIENLINYFYFIRYPNPDDLFSHITNINPRFIRSEKHKTIADIEISVKLYCFGIEFFPSVTGSADSTMFIAQDLRKVRNEGSHRCAIIANDRLQNPVVYDFFKQQTFDTIRGILKKITLKIKTELLKPSISKHSYGEISSILPGSAFVKLNDGNIIQIDTKLLYTIKDLKVQDKVKVTITNFKKHQYISEIVLLNE